MTWEVNIRHARARLALAEGDFELALADAMVVGNLREEQGRRNPTWTPWRSTAARALAHLGRRDEAVLLADTELRVARRFGAPIPIAAAMHARAVAEADDLQTDRAVPDRARRCAGHTRAVGVGPHPARPRRDAGLRRQSRRGARGAAPGAGRRRRGRCRGARRSRPARARGDRSAPAPGGARGRRGAHAASAPDLRARRRRQGQPRDRPGAVPEHQDRRDAPRGRFPQARGQRRATSSRPSSPRSLPAMCRLFARACDRAYPATFGLLEAPDSVVGAEPPRARRLRHRLLRPRGRIRTSSVARGRPTRTRRSPRRRTSCARGLFVAHIRFATTGANLERNTHPFIQAGRLFAHNGVVQGLDELEARSAAGVPRAREAATPTPSACSR